MYIHYQQSFYRIVIHNELIQTCIKHSMYKNRVFKICYFALKLSLWVYYWDNQKMFYCSIRKVKIILIQLFELVQFWEACSTTWLHYGSINHRLWIKVLLRFKKKNLLLTTKTMNSLLINNVLINALF